MALQLPSLIGTQPAVECIAEAARAMRQPSGELCGDFAFGTTNALPGCYKLQLSDFFQQAAPHRRWQIFLASMKQGAEAIKLARRHVVKNGLPSQSSNTAMTY